MGYPNVQVALVAWFLADLGVRAATELPADLEEALPFIRITPFGGADATVSIDTVHLDFDVYAAPDPDDDTRTAQVVADDLGEDIRESVRFRLPGRRIEGCTFAKVKTITRPTKREYDDEDPGIARNQSAYQITVK